jgi:hypothetical protein
MNELYQVEIAQKLAHFDKEERSDLALLKKEIFLSTCQQAAGHSKEKLEVLLTGAQ